MKKEKFIEQMNHSYIRRKIEKGADLCYTAPELQPKIVSDQVLALVDVLYETGVLKDD